MLDFARPAVKRCLRIAGHSLHCSEYLHKYCFGYHLAELFRRLDIQCVLDVGAHLGGYRNFLRNEVGFRGLILSFEPVRRSVESLKAQASRDPAWVIHDFALGAVAGREQINVMRQGLFSSFLEPDHSCVREFADLNTLDHRETVRVETLDAIMDDLRQRHRLRQVYLKMDTQGYDLSVIQGARQSLARVAALQTELSVRKIYREMPGFHEVYLHLAGLGFDLTGLYPVTRDSSLRLVELDCVMVNRRMIAGGGITSDDELNSNGSKQA